MDAAMLQLSGFSGDLASVSERVRGSVVAIRSGGGFGAGTIWPGTPGTVITNAHVTGRSASVAVMAADGAARSGRVVAVDHANDLALVQVEDAEALTPAVLGVVEMLRPGALVLAVGNPLGMPGSVTAGVLISGLGPAGNARERRLIRADVRLGPGNSGGPLADARGRVIGINAMVYGGIGLAIPVDTVTAFVEVATTATAAA